MMQRRVADCFEHFTIGRIVCNNNVRVCKHLGVFTRCEIGNYIPRALDSCRDCNNNRETATALVVVCVSVSRRRGGTANIDILPMALTLARTRNIPVECGVIITSPPLRIHQFIQPNSTTTILTYKNTLTHTPQEQGCFGVVD